MNTDSELLGKDIADIVLTHDLASIVVENVHTLDWHGHSYIRYLTHGGRGDRLNTVVLLGIRRDIHGLRDGWENAVVVTYAEVLDGLRELIGDLPGWRREHKQQLFFLDQMFDHFLEGPATVDIEDRIEFLTEMCETGESARYAYRPHEAASQEFADILAEHARQQFEDGCALLSDVKRALRTFARTTLTEQVNDLLADGPIERVTANYVANWQWCVTLHRSDSQPHVFLEFGPQPGWSTDVVPGPRGPRTTRGSS